MWQSRVLAVMERKHERYFGQMDAGAVQEIMEKALEGYFGKKAAGA